MKIFSKTLNQDFVISRRLWESLKTVLIIAASIAMSLLIGQLH